MSLSLKDLKNMPLIEVFKNHEKRLRKLEARK